MPKSKYAVDNLNWTSNTDGDFHDYVSATGRKLVIQGEPGKWALFAMTRPPRLLGTYRTILSAKREAAIYVGMNDEYMPRRAPR